MNHAITILTNAAEAAEKNHAIHYDQGDIKQADLDTVVAEDCRAAIAILQGEPIKKSPGHRIP